MKKSDVENKIEAVLNNLEKVKMSNKLRAQAVMVELETVGMLPPTTRKLVKTYVKSGMFESVEDVNVWDGE